MSNGRVSRDVEVTKADWRLHVLTLRQSAELKGKRLGVLVALRKEADDKNLHGRHFEGGAGERWGMLVLFGKPEMNNFLFTLRGPCWNSDHHHDGED